MILDMASICFQTWRGKRVHLAVRRAKRRELRSAMTSRSAQYGKGTNSRRQAQLKETSCWGHTALGSQAPLAALSTCP